MDGIVMFLRQLSSDMNKQLMGQKASIPPLDFLTIHTTMQHKLATLVYR